MARILQDRPLHLSDGTAHRFFFNDTATTEIYTLSLHDALPIYRLDVGVARLREHEGSKRPAASFDCLLRSEEHTSELQSPDHLVCRLLLEKKKTEYSLECSRVQRSVMSRPTNEDPPTSDSSRYG